MRIRAILQSQTDLVNSHLILLPSAWDILFLPTHLSKSYQLFRASAHAQVSPSLGSLSLPHQLANKLSVFGVLLHSPKSFAQWIANTRCLINAYLYYSLPFLWHLSCFTFY